MEERSCVRPGEKTEHQKKITESCVLRVSDLSWPSFLWNCFYTGQGHPMGWNAGTNDAVVLHTRDLLERSMLPGLDFSVIWSFLNILSRQLISKWSLYCLGLLGCSMTFRIPLQATVQSRKIYVKCFLLESPSGQYSSCLVKYQDIHRTQVLMQIIRHKWPQ